MKPIVKGFFDPATWTVSYVVYEKEGADCAIVDSVLDYDPKSGPHPHHLGQQADRLRAGKAAQGAMDPGDPCPRRPPLRRALPAQAAGRQDRHRRGHHQRAGRVQENLQPGARVPPRRQPVRPPAEGRRDVCHRRADRAAMSVPGHTPACMAYQVDDAVFVGDTLFMPDVGTARCDFPGGNAHTLYQSTRKLLSLPPETRLFMCHDYPPAGRDVAWQTTVADQRAGNIHVHDGVSEAEFVSHAHRARRHAGHARADPAGGAGQHPRGRACRRPKPTAWPTSRSP
jgi:glyoxylase-like metal-dependent hydrolase (beta-lactamase superfamily II)